MNREWTGIILGLMTLVAQSVLAQPNAFFSVSTAGNNLSIATTIPNHLYQQAGIKILTPGYSIQNTGVDCKLASNGYCLFSVSKSQPHSIALSGPSGNLEMILCLNGAGPVSCQHFENIRFTPTTYAYIVGNSSRQVTSCLVDPGTGDLGTCATATQSFMLPFQPKGIALNKSATKVYINALQAAYRAGGSSITACDVDSQTGLFSNCSSVNPPSPSYLSTQHAFITLNPDGSQIFLPNDRSLQTTTRVAACSTNISGGTLNCTDTGATTAASQLTGIALNQAGTVAYIGGAGGGVIPGRVAVCDVNGTTFSNCIDKTGDNNLVSFGSIYGLAVNKTSSIVYVVDQGNQKIYGCSTTPNNTAYFDSCFETTEPTPDNFTGIALNAENTFAYITNDNLTVYTCPINVNGSFGTCTTTVASFGMSYGIALG